MTTRIVIGFAIALCLLAPHAVTLACSHDRIEERSPSFSKLFSSPFLRHLAEDFSGGTVRENLPLDIKQTLQTWITALLPRTPAYFANFGKPTHLGEEREFAKSRHAMMLPPREDNPSLPNEYLVFDELLARRSFEKETAREGNFMFVSFVNWFLEDALRSKPGSNGSHVLDGTGPLIYGTVYGRTAERQHLLRQHQHGKLRTSFSDSGEEVMLMWKDVANSSAHPHRNTSVFVAGEDEMNAHWGHLFWTNTMTLRHNWICEQLVQHSPELVDDDDDLYWRARMIQHLINLRMITEDYISGFVSPHLAGNVIWKFDADECIQSEFRSAEGSPVYLEFNHLYRWHALVPDQLEYEAANVSLREIRHSSSRFLEKSLREHLAAFHNSPSGKFGFRQESRHFREVTAATIRDERAHGMQAFNAYLEHHGMRRLSAFEELTSDPELLATLQRLYRSVDDIDLYVGLNLQPALSHDELLPPLMLAMVAEHAFAFIYAGGGPCHGDPRRVSPEYLTDWGFRHVHNASLSPMQQVLASVGLDALGPDVHPFSTKPSIGAACGKPMCDGGYALGYLTSYVGLNELWGPTLWIDEFQHATLVVLLLLASVIALVALPLRSAVLWCRREDRRRADRIQRFDPIVAFNALVGLIYLLQLPAYTATALHVLFSCRFDQAVREWWTLAAVMWAIHGTLYVVDTAMRLERSFNRMLVAHHLAWFATIAITFATRDIFSAKLNVLLDYFATFEFGLFLLLAYSKWHARVLSPRARLLAVAAVVLYDATRVVQTALLVFYFTAAFPRMREYGHLWIFAAQLVLCVLLTAAQVYTMLEYARWTNIWSPQKHLRDHSSVSGGSVEESAAVCERSSSKPPRDADAASTASAWSPQDSASEPAVASVEPEPGPPASARGISAAAQLVMAHEEGGLEP